MTDYAARNRQIKTVLESVFGKGKVRVRGSRGTAYGWATVRIAHAPRDPDQRRDLERECYRLFAAHKIHIGHYDSGDYGSGDKLHLDFDRCQYAQVFRGSRGELLAKRWEDVDAQSFIAVELPGA